MARVSRIAAGRGSFHVSDARRSASLAEHQEMTKVDPRASLYPSINTLRSEQDDDETSCMDCCKTALGYVYDYTIASCIYSCCRCCKKSARMSHVESSVSVEDMEISEMKEKLKFHFMNPFQKWRYGPRRRFPWKLLVQLTSMVLVTLQLGLFAQTKFALTDFIQENTKTFVQLFVHNPVDTGAFGQIVPVPSPIAYLYTMDDLLDQINFTADAYFNLQNDAVGTYGYEWTDSIADADRLRQSNSLTLNVTKYSEGQIDPTTKTFNITGKTEMKSYNISLSDFNSTDHSIADAIEWDKLVQEMNKIKTFTLQFTISSVYIDHASSDNPLAVCFQFILLFTIKNDYQSGNMPVSLKVDPVKSDCKDDSTVFQLGTSFDSSVWMTIVDGVVIIISFISLILCVRSLCNTWHLAITVKKFFKAKFDNFKLSNRRHLATLFNFWHIGFIFSNALVIIGSILKLLIYYNLINNIEIIDITSIILGLAVFGQWCALLRFLSYFDKYNMLLLTLRISAPSVLRFIICTGILYVAFLLCGWLVMGPYHPKFRTLSIASECLFSLVNGDDMFNTYILMSDASQAAWIFSKIYLYVFIALFIYVVLSVFISLISDTYETLHEHWRDRSQGLLQDFASGKLGQAKPARTHTHSVTSTIDNEDEDYDLLRDMTQTASYGAMDRTLMVNGGPELSRTPPSHHHHLTTPHGHAFYKAEPLSKSDQFSDDEGVEPGTDHEGSSQPLFKIDDSS